MELMLDIDDGVVASGSHEPTPVTVSHGATSRQSRQRNCRSGKRLNTSSSGQRLTPWAEIRRSPNSYASRKIHKAEEESTWSTLKTKAPFPLSASSHQLIDDFDIPESIWTILPPIRYSPPPRIRNQPSRQHASQKKPEVKRGSRQLLKGGGQVRSSATQ